MAIEAQDRRREKERIKAAKLQAKEQLREVERLRG